MNKILIITDAWEPQVNGVVTTMTTVVQKLQEKGYEVYGLDVGYFAENKLESCLEGYSRVSKDVRDVVLEDLEGIDAIIHLAGLSNDPLGEFNPSLTHEINTRASIRLAELAKKAGVKRFIFSSSQSMYGISELDSELDEDNSEKNPVTAYASAKWDAEQALNSMSCREFIVTSFRPSTVFGASPRLRCDIVFNNFCHESVGGQDTNIEKVSIKKVFLGFGYKKYFYLNSHNKIEITLKKFLSSKGPSILEVITKFGSISNLTRPKKLLDVKKNFIDSKEK